jgi:hypothetical protein
MPQVTEKRQDFDGGEVFLVLNTGPGILMRRSDLDQESATATTKSKNEMRGPSPFDYAQGQDDR